MPPPDERPFATTVGGSARRLAAVDRRGRQAGLKPGMTLADALAVAPDLAVAEADPAADRALLERLAEWCGHYTPWTAADGWNDDAGGGGLWLDVSGCAHLFGGEGALLNHLTRRLEHLGLSACAAMAATPGAAWAWARYGEAARPCLESGKQRDALAGLPVAALRLPPDTIMALASLGLHRIGALYPMPRAGLTARFGRMLAHRLDQALGAEDEPISPRLPPPSFRVHAAFADPIARPEDVAEAVRRLLLRLCAQLGNAHQGLRRLEISAFRVDSSQRAIAIGTSRPTHDPVRLFRLLGESLPGLDPGFGIESLCLSARETTPQDPEQTRLGTGSAMRDEDDFARLVDSLSNRLGPQAIARLVPHASHIPERAVSRQAVTAPPPPDGWPAGRRPLRLFSRPEPVEAVAPVPDSPPLMFRWRQRSYRVTRADSAERIAPEWWRSHAPERDYYLVEDERGRRFWLFREGLYGGPVAPRWYLHGMFP